MGLPPKGLIFVEACLQNLNVVLLPNYAPVEVKNNLQQFDKFANQCSFTET